MQLTPYELELYHHGIKGQRWGVRRTDAQLGHPQKKKAIQKQNPIENIRKSQSGSQGEPDITTVVRSGNKQLVAKYSRQMDRQQLEEAMKRIDIEAKLYEMTREKTTMEKGLDVLADIHKKATPVVDVLQDVKKVYDALNGMSSKDKNGKGNGDNNDDNGDNGGDKKSKKGKGKKEKTNDGDDDSGSKKTDSDKPSDDGPSSGGKGSKGKSSPIEPEVVGEGSSSTRSSKTGERGERWKTKSSSADDIIDAEWSESTTSTALSLIPTSSNSYNSASSYVNNYVSNNYAQIPYRTDTRRLFGGD